MITPAQPTLELVVEDSFELSHRAIMLAPTLPTERSCQPEMITPAQPTLELVVEDSFELPHRGVVLAPTLPTDRFPANSVLDVELTAVDGSTRSLVGRFLIEHVRLATSSSYHGVIVLDAGIEAPAGSVIRCRLRDTNDR